MEDNKYIVNSFNNIVNYVMENESNNIYSRIDWIELNKSREIIYTELNKIFNFNANSVDIYLRIQPVKIDYDYKYNCISIYNNNNKFIFKYDASNRKYSIYLHNDYFLVFSKSIRNNLISDSIDIFKNIDLTQDKLDSINLNLVL